MKNTPARTIYEFLCRVAMRRIVIVKDGCPTGTISRGTLLRLFRNLVLSKDLLQGEQGEGAITNIDPHHSREYLEETTRQLSVQVSKLQLCLQDDNNDLMPYVVGGATGMQGLVDELLAYARYADSDKSYGEDKQSMITEGNCVD